MFNECKLFLFFDRKDYIKKITDDNVLNIIGLKGSGKTINSFKYINDDDYIVVNCDRFFDLPIDDDTKDKYFEELKCMLIKKYNSISDGADFIKCYNDIVDFVYKKNKKLIIEGNVLCDIKPIHLLKGNVLVKRTGILKCFFRSIKRDYPNNYFLSKEIEAHGKVLGKLFRLKNIIKRRKNIFKNYHEIENIIEDLEEI